jgi:resuscitation-promoting factor RpfA
MSFRRASITKSTYARRIAATAAIAGAGIALPLIAAGSASAASTSTWEAVANCESSGNWSIDTGNGFYGGLQFTESTWLAYGGGQYAQYANDATEGQQISVAEAVLASQGVGAWPVCGPEGGLSQDSGSPSVDTSGSSSNNTSGDNSSSSGSSSNNSSSSGNSSSNDNSSNDSTAPAASSAPSSSSSDDSSSAAPSSGATGTYTVVAGDTLSEIAQKEGISSWQSLYNENQTVIGGDANLIFPGQVLTLG